MLGCEKFPDEAVSKVGTVKRTNMNLNHIIFKQIFFYLAISAMWVVTACAGNDSVPMRYPEILSQGTTGDQNFLPDFSYAGYRNGAEDLPVSSGRVIQVNEFGARPDDESDDTKAIISAIAKAKPAL